MTYMIRDYLGSVAASLPDEDESGLGAQLASQWHFPCLIEVVNLFNQLCSTPMAFDLSTRFCIGIQSIHNTFQNENHANMDKI